jgi:hypothetical protein
MTVIKVLTLLAIIVFGIVVIGRGTPYLRGLDDSYKPVPCHNNNVTANCTSGPGFDRLNLANETDVQNGKNMVLTWRSDQKLEL